MLRIHITLRYLIHMQMKMIAFSANERFCPNARFTSSQRSVVVKRVLRWGNVQWSMPINSPHRHTFLFSHNSIEFMQNIPTEDIVNELEHRVDCSKRRGVRTILIGLCSSRL